MKGKRTSDVQIIGVLQAFHHRIVLASYSPSSNRAIRLRWISLEPP